MSGVQCLHLIDRKAAKKAGLKKYFTGEPCHRGHVSQRFTCSAKCSMCSRADMADHYQRNRDTIRARQSVYFRENRDEVNRRALDWYHRGNRAKEINANNSRFRRARRKMAIPSWYSEFDEFVIAEAGELSRQRASETGFDWHVDHMVPMRAKKACGLHCASNIQVIPAVMNLEKRHRMILTEPLEWLRA